MWFLSNAISITNPYFTYFGIELPYGSNFRVKDDILIEVVEDDEHSNAMKETRFGKLIKNTDYGAYAIDNKFLRDSSVFVEKKPSTASYRFAIVYRGDKYGIWRDSVQARRVGSGGGERLRVRLRRRAHCDDQVRHSRHPLAV